MMTAKIDLIERIGPGILKEHRWIFFSRSSIKHPDSTADSFKSTVLGGVAAVQMLPNIQSPGYESGPFLPARIAMLDERFLANHSAISRSEISASLF